MGMLPSRSESEKRSIGADMSIVSQLSETRLIRSKLFFVIIVTHERRCRLRGKLGRKETLHCCFPYAVLHSVFPTSTAPPPHTIKHFSALVISRPIIHYHRHISPVAGGLAYDRWVHAPLHVSLPHTRPDHTLCDRVGEFIVEDPE
jgi:hypothetical protein